MTRPEERPPDPAYDELYVYTMGRPRFILQHAVDAHAAQTATPTTKPITLGFALIGLHLHVDLGMDGAAVQRLHMRMGNDRPAWPDFTLPADRGEIDPATVLTFPPGTERDQAIDHWCAAVWKAYESDHAGVAAIAARYLA